MDIFTGIGRDQRISQANRTATDARRKADELAMDKTALEHRVDRLALVCQALWEILSERAGISSEEVTAKMTEIDLRDGTPDGKITAHAIPCPQCGHKVSSVRPTCMFCGAAIPSETIVS
jgi:hypothetical protein